MSRGPQLRCCEAKGKEGGGRGILLGSSLLFWLWLSSHCVVMGEIGAERTLAGHSSKQKPHGCREGKRRESHSTAKRQGLKLSFILALPLSLMYVPLLLHRLHSNFILSKLQLQPHPSFSAPPLPSPTGHSFLRQTQLPSWTFPFCWPAATKVLSHVKPNLQPPKT